MIKEIIAIKMNEAAEKSEQCLNNVGNALLWENAYYSWKEITQINKNNRELVISVLKHNIQLRNRLYKTANEILNASIDNRNSELAEIALTAIVQIQEMNPFLL